MTEDNKQEVTMETQTEAQAYELIEQEVEAQTVNEKQTETQTQSVKNNRKKNILETKGVVNYREDIELAYQILRNQCTVHDISQRLDDQCQEQPSYRFTILDEADVDTPKDKIYITMKNGSQMTFSKTRFLNGKRLHFDLIKFYSNKDLYISGPSVLENFHDDSEVPVKSWVIDISPFRKKRGQVSFAGDSD